MTVGACAPQVVQRNRERKRESEKQAIALEQLLHVEVS